MNTSIVEYFAEHEGYKCGYCKGTTSNYSHGMWAHTLTTRDYEGLLNRGFRRSGKYLYKPTNSITCCPSYTINLHALEFELTKSQKKVLKKVNRFLRTGVNPKLQQKQGAGENDRDKAGSDSEDITDGNDEGCIMEEINYKEAQDIDMKPSEDLRPQSKTKRTAGQVEFSSPKLPHKVKNSSPAKGEDKQKEAASLNASTPASQANVPPKDTPQKKAKEIRIEKKRQKLIAQGKLKEDEPLVKTTKPPSQGKSLEDFLAEESKQDSKLKLELKLVYTKSDEFEAVFKLEHAIYQKYQMRVHNDTEDECSAKQFRRFLCDTPLIGQDDEDVEDSGKLNGSYHQQYWLGSELIAVGVIDILPRLVSSVYLFYDPAYSFLSLGTYAALREIAFTRQLHQIQPDIKFYYMGYYIHSCPKMRYKGAYTPSYLLCPERFTWVKLTDEIRQRLEAQKYQRLDTSPTTGSKDEEPRSQNVQKVQIFFRQCVLPYPIYELKRGSADREQVQQYCDLVGEEVASEMLLYRS